MIIQTDAIVLRSMMFRESSRIVTLLTREKGKLSVLAKGARRAKSRFGSTLQPMSHIQVVLYQRPNRTLHTLRESAHVRLFNRTGEDLDKISAGLRIVELTSALLQEEEENPSLFDLVATVLARLDESQTHIENLLLFFQMQMAAALGFAPDFDRDSLARIPDEGGLLVFDTGAILPLGEADGKGRDASRVALRAFAVLARADLDTVMRMRLEPAVCEEASRLIEDYLRYHVEDVYPGRGAKVLRQLRIRPPLDTQG